MQNIWPLQLKVESLNDVFTIYTIYIFAFEQLVGHHKID